MLIIFPGTVDRVDGPKVTVRRNGTSIWVLLGARVIVRSLDAEILAVVTNSPPAVRHVVAAVTCCEGWSIAVACRFPLGDAISGLASQQ